MKLYQIEEPGIKQDDSFITNPQGNDIALGIDLGTTNSLIAYLENTRPIIIKDRYSNKNYLPSIACYEEEKITIGEEALLRKGKIISSVKRLMNDGATKIVLGASSVTPVEVSAEILKRLKENAELSLGQKVKKVVITVPAYFSESARQATKDAARIAGLEVLRLISEPTAAAIAYGLEANPNGLYAVYDLGGGTFDISILRMQKGVFQVIASGGDSELGGDDIDKLLLEYLINKYQIKKKAELLDYLKSREIKEALTYQDEWHGSFMDFPIAVSKIELEKIAEELVNKTITCFKQALNDAEVDAQELNEIILVGGSTRFPLIKNKIESKFGKKPLDSINPDEVVAIGAAIQAHGLTHGRSNLLLDVIPLSLGIEVANGLVDKIIPRNTPIPASRKQTFATQKDGQTGFVLHILQGESEKVNECRSLAKFELKGLPSRKAGEVKLEVNFQIDADGILTVAAKELETGKNHEVLVKPSYGLSESEIIDLIKRGL
jgi:molecular chaperone HscA